MSLFAVAAAMIWFMPLVAWLGLFTLLSLVTTASYGYMLFKGKVRSFKTHMALAATTITIGVVHMALALGFIFGF